MRNSKTNELVLTGLFTAIIIIMAFTPLGYIPLVVINATIIHIPVILGSLFCGPRICIRIYQLSKGNYSRRNSFILCIFAGACRIPGRNLRYI